MDSRRDFTSKKVFSGYFSELGEKANSALPHAAAGDHHLEEEEEGGVIGAGSQVRRERKEIETAAIQKIEGNSALQSRERSICCSAN